MAGQNNALVVIDIQNDFCPSGRLAVAGGDEIINEINELMAQFGLVILTQDWHPPDHQSFASQHTAAKPFDLNNRGITELTIEGMATDYCVRYSAEDAARLGLNVSVKLNLCRAIDMDDSLTLALDSMRELGVKLC